VRFALDEDIVALRDGVAAYLAKACPPEAVRSAWDGGGGPGAAPELWAGLAAMGVLGVLAPPGAGGVDAGHVAAAAVLVEAGRVAAPLPLAEVAGVAVPVLAAAGDPTGILPGVVAGHVQVAVGTAAGVPAASSADWYLLGTSLHPRSEVTLSPRRSVDRTRDLAAVTPSGPGVPLQVPAGAPAAADLAALASAAVLLGLGRGMLDQAVAHAKQRQQFGVPIGSFQAVKHRLADALLGLELAAPTVWAAAHDLHRRLPHAPRSVSLAKAACSDAASATARTALQAHGAMGYTDDHHLHFWLKRAWCLAAEHGTAAWHRDRIARHLGLVPTPSPPPTPTEERP
jgi:alkylation response protein AidB-like acyl-CoA dehydrogenase